MTILAVDTACGTASVALATAEGAIIASLTEPETSRQAERLLPMVEELLQQQGLTYADLTLLASSVGPGSFTGLRIGLTAIKGIALVTGLSATGITTLQAVAWQLTESNSPALALINASRGQVYAQRFGAHAAALSEPTMIDIADIPAYAEGCACVGGNCAELVAELRTMLPQVLPDMPPHAEQVAAVAAHRFRQGITAPTDPLYIRKPDAKLPAVRP